MWHHDNIWRSPTRLGEYHSRGIRRLRPGSPVSPLSHAISLFPLNRAGSVWRGKGNLMLHTEDGSAIEVGLASSQQNKHTELAPGDPGLGKSVLINTLSEIQISSAQKNLPFIAYIDKGYSAQGLVQLIRDSLPPERKDEAVGIILSNDPEYTRNLLT